MVGNFISFLFYLVIIVKFYWDLFDSTKMATANPIFGLITVVSLLFYFQYKKKKNDKASFALSPIKNVILSTFIVKGVTGSA